MQFLNGNKCLSFKHPTKLHSCVTLQSDFFLFLFTHFHHQSLPCGSAGKESTCSAKTWVQSWVGKIPRRRERLPTPVFWPREFHGLYSPWGRKESDMTWATFTHSLIARRRPEAQPCHSPTSPGRMSSKFPAHSGNCDHNHQHSCFYYYDLLWTSQVPNKCWLPSLSFFQLVKNFF